MPTADELMELARACANKIDLSDRRQVPSLEDVEEQCAKEYEDLLDVLQEDEVFGAVDLDRQQQILDSIVAALGEDKRALVDELSDQHTRHVWLLQEAAFHVGLAVGLRLAGAPREH
ncbi:MAG: hypothetical protein EHM24_19545 [Acidobacteria bacterium]|nr:MAG: hypothetical protein EHM24_19545 [Acidobacteriota bacterium]